MKRLARFAGRAGCSTEKAWDLMKRTDGVIENFAPYMDDYGDARRAEEEARRAGEPENADEDRTSGEGTLKSIKCKVDVYSTFS